MTQHHSPRVDINAGSQPFFSFIKEEDEVVGILTVQIFLVAHRLIIVALYKKGIIYQRNIDDALACGMFIYTQAHIMSCYQSVGSQFCHCHGDGCLFSSLRRGYSCLAGILAPSRIDEFIICQETIVVVEITIVVGNDKVEIIRG